MKIAINLHGFIPGCGGVETYIVNILDALQRLATKHEFVVFCGPRAAKSLQLDRSDYILRVTDYERPGFGWLLRTGLLQTLGMDLLKREFSGLNLDLVHHPLTVLNPRGMSAPSVLTFHDMQQEYHPEFFSDKELAGRHRTYRSSVEEAGAVVAVSHHAKMCLVDRYQISPAKIHVIHHGVATVFTADPTEEFLKKIKKKYNLEKDYMVYPAATWNHKNHLRLLDALEYLDEHGGFSGELILTGSAQGAHSSIVEKIASSKIREKVRLLGYVSEVDLAAILRLARIMVFPSLFEGFGLPIVEAMACGCPVVCSNRTSLPEVAGSAAIYFDPDSSEMIASAIQECWDDAQLRRQLSQLGRVRAAQFSWSEAARKTVEVYESVG